MHRSNRLAENQSSLPGKTKFHSHNTNHSYSGHTHGDRQSAHPHVHSEESLRSIVNRLSRIEGHIRGIKTMVQESRPCPDVLVQQSEAHWIGWRGWFWMNI